jgi:hypothetical protein
MLRDPGSVPTYEHSIELEGVNAKKKRQITFSDCRSHFPHGLDTEASRLLAATTSEKLSGACPEGAEPGEGSYIDLVSEMVNDLWLTSLMPTRLTFGFCEMSHWSFWGGPPRKFTSCSLDQKSSNVKDNKNNQNDQQESYCGNDGGNVG